MKLALAVSIAILTFIGNPHYSKANPVTCDARGCSDWNQSHYAQSATKAAHKASKFVRRVTDRDHKFSNSEITFLPHPAGCPRIKFCGCGVALKVFGKLITRGSYALAAYWKRLPRTSPAPGMVAVFGSYHVALIEKVYDDGTALLYDPNSGGHQTRLWRRSIRNATIVNPHGAMASL